MSSQLFRSVLLAAVVLGTAAHATPVAEGQSTVALHASGMMLSAGADAVNVGGLEIDFGFGVSPRFRMEGVFLGMKDIESTGPSSFAVGVRPLFRAGSAGFLGDLELGGTAYLNFEPEYAGYSSAVAPAVGPHVRYTVLMFSVFYEPLLFLSQNFKMEWVGDELEPKPAFFPIRLGVGLQF